MPRSPWLAVFALAAACGPKLPDQLTEGRWVRVHTWEGEPAPCPEAVAQLDRLVDWLGERTQRPPASGFRVDYYVLRSATELSLIPQCAVPHASGCAVGASVYATDWKNEHEVVHAFMSELGFPPQLFVEGVAVMFGCGGARFAGEPLAETDLAPLLDNAQWSAALSWPNYQAAGSLTKFLVDRHGLDALVRFYEKAPHGPSAAELDSQWMSAFGTPRSTSLAEWAAAGTGLDGEYCIARDDRCDTPELGVAAAGAATVSSEVSCIDTVVGLDVGAAESVRVRFGATQEGRALTLRRCDRSGSPEQELVYAYSNVGLTGALAGRRVELWTPLMPGRYALTVSRTHLPLTKLDSEAPPGGTASIEVSAQTAPLSSSCAGPVEVAVPDDTWVLRLAGAQDAGSAGLVRFAPASPRKVEAGFFSGLVAKPSLCSVCGTPPSGCSMLGPSMGGNLSSASVVTVAPGADGGSWAVELVLAAR